MPTISKDLNGRRERCRAFAEGPLNIFATKLNCAVKDMFYVVLSLGTEVVCVTFTDGSTSSIDVTNDDIEALEDDVLSNLGIDERIFFEETEWYKEGGIIKRDEVPNKIEPKETVRGKRYKDLLIERIDACIADEKSTATDKLLAVTAALELMIKYESEI